jgi:DNA-directed RNA polymerase specialized sigma24 family protein
MKNLYLLALLLTAEQHAAECCFVSSLGDCMDLRSALNEWADSWTRRVVLQNAIRMLGPAINNEEEVASSHCSSAIPELNPVLHAVLQLKTFDRFVFVMSVLEGFSDSECSRLLGCSKRDILTARAKALEHVVTRCREDFLQNHPQGGAQLRIDRQ